LTDTEYSYSIWEPQLELGLLYLYKYSINNLFSEIQYAYRCGDLSFVEDIALAGSGLHEGALTSLLDGEQRDACIMCGRWFKLFSADELSWLAAERNV
jgi:hypothetical protein